MSNSLLGLHWIRTHPDNRDLSHIEAMQYRSVKIFEWQWNNRDACRDLLSVLPANAYILARDHPLSEQKSDMFGDPVGTGTRHANDWAMKVASGNYHLPVDRTFFLGINEPDATSGDRNAIDLYTSTFLDRLRVHGLRGGAFNFSTGHPRTVDGTGGTSADYSVFERSRRAIVGGHHIGVLHIYGTAAVPCAPGHFDRLKACDWQDVEWVVGECGPDEHVIGGGQHDGYLISMKPNIANLCPWLDSFILGVNDSRIHSFQVYTYDFSHPWASFDTRAIRDDLESYDWQHTKQQPPKPTTPPVTTPGAIRYISAPNGLRLRAQPNTDSDTLEKVPYGTQIRITGVSDVKGWVKVRYGDKEGFMYSQYISVQEPKPLPVPEPTLPPPPTPVPVDPSGNEWERSIAFVLEKEGGFQNNPADPGNYYKGELIGTKYGISAKSWGHKYDIPTLTVEQAKSIYLEHYWRKSGADRLAWPYCLLVLDTAVLHGTGAAEKWLKEVGPGPLAFAAKRLRVYVNSENWEVFGRGWVARVADLLEECAK